MVKSACVALIVVLGVVWFALQEQQAGAQPRSEAVFAAGGADGAGLSPDSAGQAVSPIALRRDEGATPAGQALPSEASLRESMRTATTLKDASRAALALGLLVTDASEARQMLSAALQGGGVSGAQYEEVGARLRELNRRPQESLLALIGTKPYAVKSNDSLWKLCNKTLPASLGVSPEVGLIKLVNGLSQDALRVGQTLAIPVEPLRIRVDSTQLGLSVFVGGQAVAAYRVGLGKEGRTPLGAFTVIERQENPTWYHAGKAIPFGDPENVLGTRWLGFDERADAVGYGIHGTSQPETIGLFESMGCVRMRNAEVEELFELVARGTQVEIL
ncbi:MAG: L,D-transpeptidase family protein [Planctomycetota bacterium]